MSPLLKFLLGGVAALILAVGGVLAYVIATFDPNDHKPELSAEVQRLTGHAVEIRGDVGLTVFPWLGATVSDLVIANPPGFTAGEPLARIGQLQLGLRLWPLLNGELEFGVIRIAEADLRLETAADGRGNWEAQAQADEAGPTTADDGNEPRSLRIAGVVVERSRLRWVDAGEVSTLSLERVQLGAFDGRGPAPLDLAGRYQIDPDSHADFSTTGRFEMSADPLRLSYGDVSGSLAIKHPSLPGGELALRLAGSMRHATDDVAGGLRMDIQASVPDAPEQTAFDLAVSGGAERFNLDSLKGTLLGQEASGRGSLRPGNPMVVRAEFDLAGFDADRWMPKGEDSAAAGKGAEDDAELLPVDLLRALDLDLRVSLRQLQLRGLRLADALWVAEARPGRPFRHRLSLNAYGGTIEAENQIDVRGREPTHALKLKASTLGLGELIRDGWASDWITGTTSLDLSLNGSGNSMKSLRASANGEAGYRLTDGELRGISLLDLVQKASAKLNGPAATGQDGPAATRITELAGRALIRGGRVQLKQLAGSNPWVNVAGDGWVDLFATDIDATLTSTVLDSERSRSIPALAHLKGMAIPVRIRGTLTDPKYSLDLEQLIKARARQQLDPKVAAERQRLEKKVDAERQRLEQKIGDKLGDLFGGRKAAPAKTEPQPTAPEQPAPESGPEPEPAAQPAEPEPEPAAGGE